MKTRICERSPGPKRAAGYWAILPNGAEIVCETSEERAELVARWIRRGSRHGVKPDAPVQMFHVEQWTHAP